MTETHLETVVGLQQRRFPWVAILPKRRAWLQSLALLPFGLPIANFLGSSFNIAINLLTQENNYILAIVTIFLSFLTSVIFFAFLFHWLWFLWKQTSPSWYPKSTGLWAGFYATMTIALSFGIVSIVTDTFNICNTHSLGSIGQTLLCNLDQHYGFEAKSWFGLWFIIAAYVYQAERWIKVRSLRLFRRHATTVQQVETEADLATTTGEGIISNSGEH